MTTQPTTKLLTESGKLSNAFQRLLELQEVPMVNRKTPLEKIDRHLQQEWFPSGKPQPALDRPITEIEVDIFRRLGMIDPIVETQNEFAGGIIPGGKVTAARKYLANLLSRWSDNENMHFEHEGKEGTIILLGSSRPIGDDEKKLLLTPMEGLPFRKGWTAPEVMPTREAEMMAMVFDQSEGPDEAGWEATLITAPMQEDGERKPRNASFRDTILAWLATHPIAIEEKPWLLATGALYAPHHGLVLESVMRNARHTNFQFGCIGYPANLKLNANIFYAEVAKQVHELAQLQPITA